MRWEPQTPLNKESNFHSCNVRRGIINNRSFNNKIPEGANFIALQNAREPSTDARISLLRIPAGIINSKKKEKKNIGVVRPTAA